MQTIPQIDDPQEIQKAYLSMTQIYGTDIFSEPRRALGCLADMAPKLDREYEILSIALKNGIPSLLQSAGNDGKALKEKGTEALDILKQNGLGGEEAIELVENLGAALKLKISVRPDYTKGGDIPYAKENSRDIREAIRAMDHIRWFLNHEKDYQWHSGKDVLSKLRKMMGNPEKNRTDLEEKYKDLVHRFGNNPYKEYILLEGDEPKADFESDAFKDYFITIEGMPVPLGFAKKFKSQEVSASNRSWDKKKEDLKDKVEELKNRISSAAPSGDIQTAKNFLSAGKRFIIWSLIFIGVFLFLVKDFAPNVAYEPFFLFAKASKMNVIAMFNALKTMNFGTDYYKYIGILLLGGVVGVFLLISVLGTVIRCVKVKKAGGGLPKKLEKAENALKKEIPDAIGNMEKTIKGYLTGKQEKASFSKKDFRSVLKDASNVSTGGKLKNPVSTAGRRLRVLLFLLAAVNVYNFQNGAVSNSALGAQEIVGYMASGMPGFGEESEFVAKSLTGANVLREKKDVDLSKFTKVTIADATQSSNVNPSNGYSYTVWEALDGDEVTSWQEGAEGSGDGEFIYMTFDREYQVKYLSLKLGNWRNDGYEKNNRPSHLLFTMGGQEFLYEFSDEKREFILMFDTPVKSSELRITLQGAYKGNKWDDTCIAEVGLYEDPNEEQASAKEEEKKAEASVEEASAKKQQSSDEENPWKGRINRADQNGTISAGKTLVQDTMASYLLSNVATRAAYVLDVGNREEYGVENSDEPMPASALVAVPIMFTVAAEAEKENLNVADMATFHYTFNGRGKLNQNSDGLPFTILRLLQDALQYSDNNAINSLIDFLGTDRINQVCHDYGFESVNIQAKIGETSAEKENYISAKDAAMMVNAVYQDNFDRIDRSFLESNFHMPSDDTANGGMYSAGQNYPVFLNFNGVRENLYNEIGLFQDGDKVFIVSIFTTDGNYTASMDMVKELTGYIASTL